LINLNAKTAFSKEVAIAGTNAHITFGESDKSKVWNNR